MTPAELRRAIRKLREDQPITQKLEQLLAISRQQRQPPWYRSQKEHWLGWLSDYDGPGYYRRRNWHRSADFVYNHIGCAPMTLWLGEAVGVPYRVVQKASAAAQRSGANANSQCRAIRALIPWGAIEQRL